MMKSVAAAFAVLAVPSVSAEVSTFVPACIAKQCGSEALALGRDDYVSSVTSCAAKNFGPCPAKAWQCLGDKACRQALTCGPKVFNSCKADLWKMITDPKEREKITCLLSCDKGGKINPFCVTFKCGKEAIKCLADRTCLHAALCPAEALKACSLPAFGCLFGTDKVCHQNLQCLTHGATECGAPAINMLTDSKIADFVECAGNKCPHPAAETVVDMIVPTAAAAAEVAAAIAVPGNAPEQLLCIAAHCSVEVLEVATSQDNKDLLHCALKGDMPNLCSSAWDCLGDAECQKAVSCFTAPFDTCKGDVWKLLTDATQRKRLEHAASCVRSCEKKHAGDFVEATLCVFDSCGADVLDCVKDPVCRSGVQCLPHTASECAMPSLDAYVHKPLFKNATQCLVRGAELCGRGAVEMLRNPQVAKAVRCASKCTRPPSAGAFTNVVV